ncbi:MAG TPA: rRNA maturation RNase YbeY [Candidatus Limnocylindrales bacterium]|nr:rRNA maturation RNase YbeY [Candidatus Limnocylindrales bacterium]
MSERFRSIYLRPCRIDLTIRAGVTVPLPSTALARAASTALEAAGAPSPASLGIILSDDAELTTLNERHMDESGPTDVLSFPLLQPSAFPASDGGSVPAAPGPPGRRPHLGDIVVSVERAAAQAARGHGGQTGDVAWSAADELRLLVTHGALHVCGWDHVSPEEEAAMRALERRLLAG